jgi:nebulin
VLYSDSFRKQIQGKAAYVLDTPEMRRVRETQRHISTVSQELLRWGGQPAGTREKVNDRTILFSPNEFMKFQVKYHEDFEKHKGCFTPVVTDPITERVKKNMQDFSDISYRGIQRKVVEMEQKRNDQDQETVTGNWDLGESSFKVSSLPAVG